MQTNKTNEATRALIQSGKYSWWDFCNPANPMHICTSTYYLWLKRDFTCDDCLGSD